MTTETPPKILGVEMEHGDFGWLLAVGPFHYELQRSFGGLAFARRKLQNAYEHILFASEAECVTAIERELLAIRAAIPATEEPAAKLDRAKVAELIATARFGLNGEGIMAAHGALDKLAAMLGAKEHTNAE